MKIIGTLGPEGTFSDMAVKKYIKETGGDFKIEYCSSIKKTLEGAGTLYDYCLLPIENFSEGFVTLVLDALVDANLNIIGEILLPINFSFVSHCEKVHDISKVFVQFVAKNQCAEFLESLSDVEVISTESNIYSLTKLTNENEQFCGAIVPCNSYNKKDFNTVISNVNDFQNNQTRFLVLAKEELREEVEGDIQYKTSIIVLIDDDYPGQLTEILAPLSQRGINLSSITSRPTRTVFGRYNFFIGIDGHISEDKVGAALEDISKRHRVINMGSYRKGTM
jgi:prephenate dehydratase